MSVRFRPPVPQKSCGGRGVRAGKGSIAILAGLGASLPTRPRSASGFFIKKPACRSQPGLKKPGRPRPQERRSLRGPPSSGMISSMPIHTLLLDLFGSIALISAAMVIVSKNPIHSVIFLILVFCNTAGLLTLLKIEFIAMMFLIIYVGAIAVLFLFVVMMLNIKMNSVHATQ